VKGQSPSARGPVDSQAAQRFLFLFSDTGGGHRASAQAVKNEMHRLYGSEVSVEMVDVFVALGRWPFSKLPDWYPALVKLKGIPWGIWFHLTDGPRRAKILSKLLWPYVKSSFCNLLRQHPADVIISFHPVPNYTLMLALQTLGWDRPAAIVAVDLVTVHACWFVPGGALYAVPTPAAKGRAVHWGISAEKIEVTGMPIRRGFVEAMTLSQAAARRQLNLPDDKPVVLMIGGGEGMGPLPDVVRAVGTQARNAHLVAIAGHNRELYQELTHLDVPTPLQVEGFVSNMEIWMRAADILVTKAGPNTLAEAFVTGLPIVLYTALPGQEEGNVTHVVDNHAGLWAARPEEAALAVDRLIRNPKSRETMAANARALGKPDATEQIARHVSNLAPEPMPGYVTPWSPERRSWVTLV
jgi:1,2-diacylglycerol 3-beta-galactosyltransferase